MVDEARNEIEGRLHHTLLDLMPVMWHEFIDLKKTYRTIEKKYYGFLGVKYGKKKKESLELEDEAKIQDLISGLHTINSYCMTHKKPYLNEKAYHLQFKIRDFLTDYRTKKN